ncbi:MAG: transposase [Euzebyales bacterium]|nr:transposase [Euzebyales bacterium]
MAARVHLRPRPPARQALRAAADPRLGVGCRSGCGADDHRRGLQICEVHGYQKQGAAYGYTRQLGYHPVLATRADTGEVLHTRMRKGSANTMRGAQRFIRETIGRIRRAGASGPLTLRADSHRFESPDGHLDAVKHLAGCVDERPRRRGSGVGDEPQLTRRSRGEEHRGGGQMP